MPNFLTPDFWGYVRAGPPDFHICQTFFFFYILPQKILFCQIFNLIKFFYLKLVSQLFGGTHILRSLFFLAQDLVGRRLVRELAQGPPNKTLIKGQMFDF